MKRLLGKALGILLSVTMMVSLVPGMAVFAAVDEGGETTNEESDSKEYSEALIAVLKMYDALPSVEDFELSDADDFYDFIVALESLEETDFPDLFDAIPELEDTIGQYLDVLDNLLEEAEDDFFNKVKALPDPEDITLDDEADVKAARESFEKLPKYIQEYYLDDVEESEASSFYEKLVACEKKIADLKAEKEAADKAAADKEKVNAVVELIKALPDPDDVVLEDLYQIYEAIDAFYDLEELTSEVGEEYVNKLFEDRYIVEVLDLEDSIALAEMLLDKYSDLLTEDLISALETALEAANEVLDAEEPDVYDIIEANMALIDAIWDANYVVWKNFTIIEGADATYLVNSDSSIIIRIRQEGIEDWAYELFIDAGEEILIDGEKAPDGTIKTRKGSLIIELMPDLLKTLSVGEHKLTVKFDNDVTLDLVFTVRAATDVPASGESVSPAVYVGIAMVLLAGAGFVVNKRMAKKES